MNKYLSSEEVYILVAAVKYQLPLRSYGSVLIGNYIVNNMERIDFITLHDILQIITNHAETKQIPVTDSGEWIRVAHKIEEFLRKD